MSSVTEDTSARLPASPLDKTSAVLSRLFCKHLLDLSVYLDLSGHLLNLISNVHPLIQVTTDKQRQGAARSRNCELVFK